VIIAKPILHQLGAASEAAIPSKDDGQLVVMPVVFPAVPLIDAFNPGSNALTMTTSFANSAIITRVNQASTTTNIAILSRGLWTINWTLSCSANYLHTGSGKDCALFLLSGVQGRSIAELYAAIGSSSNSGSFTFLLREEATIQLIAGTNGVGQELIVNGCVLAEKHL